MSTPIFIVLVTIISLLALLQTYNVANEMDENYFVVLLGVVIGYILYAIVNLSFMLVIMYLLDMDIVFSNVACVSIILSIHKFVNTKAKEFKKD